MLNQAFLLLVDIDEGSAALAAWKIAELDEFKMIYSLAVVSWMLFTLCLGKTSEIIY